MVHAAMLLDVGVSAVVVGQDKSFGRDDFARTSASELHHGVFDGEAVRTIDGFHGYLQPEFHHGGFILHFQVWQHPHAFIRLHDCGGQKDGCGEKKSFHIY